MKMFDLSGKVAIVTGGNGGIGLGMAEGLAQAGASIAIGARSKQKNAAAVEKLATLGGKAIAVEVDVTKKEDWERLLKATLAAFGRVDILINNAGITLRKAPEAYTLEEWHHVVDTNLTSAFLGSQAVYPEMKKVGAGKIINTASLTSILGAPFNAPYVASKGGMLQLTRALATAWAKDNIQVNAVLPGWIDTDLAKGARRDMPTLDERVRSRAPAGRWGQPEDFAGIAVLLASPASGYITGTGMLVDGGYSIML